MEQLLEKLGINWGLLIAQIVNFMIVLGLLSYFVYRPFLNLLDARRERVRKAMEDSKRIEDQMKEFEALRLEEMKKLDREGGEYLDKMRRKADELQEQMIATATKEAEAIVANAHKRAEDERKKMFEEVMKTVHTVVIRMTEKILEREFSDADQKRIMASLEDSLPTMLK